MRNLAEGAHWIAVTLWVGGLWVVGYVVVPVLFHTLDDRSLAGMLAGKLFVFIAYIGMACGFYLVVFQAIRMKWAAFKKSFFWLTMLMLALVVIGQFGAYPIVANLKQHALPFGNGVNEKFATWHGVATILYALQSLFGVALVLRQKTALP